ncbi:3'(2'),5'-bisphosphate nucleotidase CysQ [Ornithinimicrobium sp. CNJ-824]|uniref:3'(2'),5'-bisphosphate nucleotidase CysQ n=1 Tax=Ornithinimicrobium sp. CNJ-824 TaxID=1904966 RepID=UPI00095F9E9A|nr:3'(2'),5'-bisphosphate nucleotidase CysQ [Ornithinimicrobium sp. CNJ-824]OLT21794.1 3'(2'),5'-bisphosphate nucleotidase CysQ [Ornithinimicrobium sp. CNJ-824]
MTDRTLHSSSRDLAEQAGAVLLELRARLQAEGVGPREMKRAGDRAAQESIAGGLARLHPGDAVLSEEAPDDLRRLSCERVWIVDPLDGTREFGEPPRDDWAVHVAVWEGGELVAGTVALPARGVVHSTGPFAAGRPPTRRPGPLRLAVSRSRPTALVVDLSERLQAELVPMGSAGVKAMAVVDGTVDAYVHAGGQFEWDSAAPVAVARAHGLHTSRVDGSALRYNAPDPWLPDLVVCRPGVAELLLSTIAVLPDAGADRCLRR